MKKEESSFEEQWPVYALGAFIYLILHLAYCFSLLPGWVVWIPIVFLSIFAISVWSINKIKTYFATRKYSNDEQP